MKTRWGIVCAGLYAVCGLWAVLAWDRASRVFLGLGFLVLAAGQGLLALLAARRGGKTCLDLMGPAALILGTVSVWEAWGADSGFRMVCGLVWLGLGALETRRAVTYIQKGRGAPYK